MAPQWMPMPSCREKNMSSVPKKNRRLTKKIVETGSRAVGPAHPRGASELHLVPHRSEGVPRHTTFAQGQRTSHAPKARPGLQGPLDDVLEEHPVRPHDHLVAGTPHRNQALGLRRPVRVRRWFTDRVGVTVFIRASCFWKTVNHY